MSAAPAAERISRLDDLEDEWKALAERADHPFATWEWNEGAWRHLGRGDLYSFACRDEDGRLAAVLPMYVARRIGTARIARFIGPGDLRGPVCAPEGRARAGEAMRAAVGPGRDRCQVLLAERLPGGSGWDAALGGRPLATHVDPVLPLAGETWDGLLAARSRNFRQQVRRRERKLVEEHGLTFRLSSGAERARSDFETLVGLHGRRWGGQTTGVFEGASGEFQREFAAAAERRGWLRLWIAEVDGEPAAAWYGWRFAGSEWYYQAGRDTRFDDLSLGFVMLAHTVREACEDGVDSYRFLDGAEPYKWRFATADLRAESRAYGAGTSGRAVALGGQAAARLRASLRSARGKGAEGKDGK